MIDIKKNCEGARSGYVFKLEERSGYEGTVTLDTATTVAFTKGSYYIYINSSAGAPASNTLMEQYESLQRALDYLSIRGIQYSSVKVPFSHYFYWQLLNNGYSLKLTDRAISRSSAKPGNISKLQVHPYHEAFRYFRFAQIAHDLYDAYRNLWLSFESLITTYSPRSGKAESEESWYCRALIDLAQTTKSKELSDLLQKRTDATLLMRELYKNTRCLLFHSKYGENKLIPHDLKLYESIKTSLAELTIIVTAIAKYHYSIQSNDSWMNPDIFIDSYKDMFEGLRLVVSDLEYDEILPTERFNKLQPVVASFKVFHQTTKMDNHVEHLFTSNIAIDKVGSQQVRRFSFVKDDKELIAFTLDENLILENVSNLEIESILDFGFIGKPRTYDYRI